MTDYEKGYQACKDKTKPNIADSYEFFQGYLARIDWEFRRWLWFWFAVVVLVSAAVFLAVLT